MPGSTCTAGRRWCDGVRRRRSRCPADPRPRAVRPGRCAVVASAADTPSAAAATVATRPRSGVTSPLPSGCRRLDRKITYDRDERIDPDRRAGEAGVAERADRKQLAAIRGEAGVDVPAEAAHARHAWRRRGRDHPRDGRGDSTCAAPSAAAVQQHPRKARQIARGAEEAGVPGDAAHAPRRRIVHDAAQRRRGRRVARPRGHRVAPLGRGDARQLVGAGLKPVSVIPSGWKISRCTY